MSALVASGGKPMLVGVGLVAGLLLVALRKRQKAVRPAVLSSRGQRATIPALSYLEAFLGALGDQYDSATNPDGVIVLAVAENKLPAGSALWPKLAACSERTPETPNYGDMKGMPRLRTAVARLLERTLAKPMAMRSENVVVGAGAGCILSTLFYAIAEAGDAVLIPAPYYPAFDNDLNVMAGVVPWPVHTGVHPYYEITADALRCAHERALAAGHRPRALLLSSPHNPLGRCLTRRELYACIRFCAARAMHLVSDEIYMLSVFGKAAEFTSVLRLLATEGKVEGWNGWAADRLHVVWGLSKDFCASGHRVGVLYTESNAVHKALDNLSYFGAVSNDTQCAWAQLLEDENFVDGFLAENRKQLRAASARLEEACVKAGFRAPVPAPDAGAGLFVILDMRPFLPPRPSWDDERDLFEVLLREARVLLTPGRDCHFPQPGFFRCCFAWVPQDALELAVRRMRSLVFELALRRMRGAFDSEATTSATTSEASSSKKKCSNSGATTAAQ